jgi:hypothetical protein
MHHTLEEDGKPMLNFAARALRLLMIVGALLPACTSDDEPLPVERAAEQPALNAVPRDAFNKIAVELYLPLYWRADDDKNGAIGPQELAVIERSDGVRWSEYVDNGAFTPRFITAFTDIARVHESGLPTTSTDESVRARFETNLRELRQGKPILVYTDFSGASDADRAVVEKILEAARHIETLHARQLGVDKLLAQIPTGDTVAHAIFERNQGPWCVAPKTEADPACGALTPPAPRLSGLYPVDVQASADFCEMLQARPDQSDLLDPFVVVAVDNESVLRAMPYHVFYGDLMRPIASLLDEAATLLVDPNEDAFRAYLRAAANAFRTNDWPTADEAWSRMNVSNSKWYLRIAPDEVYFEPCGRKAGFHVSFARINPDSIAWQSKLDPVKGEMEQALATLAGPPYTARAVSFALPDFIDIVLNAGDARSPHGATIGQSLPNWGAVANEGRGRTVAMTNLYTDDDSRATMRTQAESLLCPTTAALFDVDPAYGTMSTVLHEAAHNLGPSHEYRAFGKTDDEAFGGPLASTMEELKAQTSALYFADWLTERGMLDDDFAMKSHIRDLTWMFGHVSRGMTSPDGRPKPYSQLSAIQLGFLLEKGAVIWRADAKAANGSDMGCFDVDTANIRSGIDALAQTVLPIKGRGDRAAAEELLTRFVVDGNPHGAVFSVVTERWLRAERASFIYAVKR